MTNNSIMRIFPYFHKGVWVFDDETFELVAEPFVGDTNLFIDHLVRASALAPRQPFCLTFSDGWFPGTGIVLDHSRPDLCGNGNWYASESLPGFEGWLCPVLLLYFGSAPKTIYAGAN